MRLRPLLTAIFLLISASVLLAQSPTKVQDFTLINAQDNNNVSLSEYKSKKAIVVIFTSNYCPYSKLYEKRIQQLIGEYAGKNIQFILINPNTSTGSTDESGAEMKKRMELLGINVPYLIDKEHVATQIFGASKTPEVYVLSEGNMIAYAGAFDDNPQVEGDVSKNYLKEAIDAVLSGKFLSVRANKTTGCMIKKPLAGR